MLINTNWVGMKPGVLFPPEAVLFKGNKNRLWRSGTQNAQNWNREIHYDLNVRKLNQAEKFGHFLPAYYYFCLHDDKFTAEAKFTIEVKQLQNKREIWDKFKFGSHFLLSLATKIPKNGLKIFPDNLQKCSKNISFISKNLVKTSKNLQKS